MLYYPTLDVCVMGHVRHFGNVTTAGQIKDDCYLGDMHERGTANIYLFLGCRRFEAERCVCGGGWGAVAVINFIENIVSNRQSIIPSVHVLGAD